MRATRAITSPRRAMAAMRVVAGSRPGGISSMVETSMSAYSAMVKVRGIGVAVITS